MKAAGLLTVMEAKKLAGVSSVTIAPTLLRTLSETCEEEAEASGDSIFTRNPKREDGERRYLETKSFLDNEVAFREAFAKGYGGKGEARTKQVSVNAFPLALRRSSGSDRRANVFFLFCIGDCYL